VRKNLTDEEKTKITEYGRLQCGISEVAYLLGYPTVDLLKSRTDFNEVYKKALAEGKIELRKYQFEAAASGNATMLVWLGKQYLGQKEQNASDDAVVSKALESVGNLIEQLKESK